MCIRDRDDIQLAVDKTSEMYIMGSEIDYVQELMGSFLKINNPLTKSSCGCGESFSVWLSSKTNSKQNRKDRRAVNSYRKEARQSYRFYYESL